MGIGYANNRFHTNQTISFPTTGALNGTNAAAVEKDRHTFMHNATVTDWNIFYTAGGTQGTLSLLLAKSAAGTGAATAIGTIALGTQATGTIKDGSATETNFAAGDDLVILVAAGTATTVPDVLPRVNFKEHFVTTM